MFDFASPILGYKAVSIAATDTALATAVINIIGPKQLCINLPKEVPARARARARARDISLVNSHKYIIDRSDPDNNNDNNYLNSDSRLLNGRVVVESHHGNWNIDSAWCFGLITDLQYLINIEASNDSNGGLSYIFSKAISDNESTDFNEMSKKYFAYNSNIH